MTFTLSAMCFVGTGVYFLAFIAPHMPEPINKCRLFLIVGKDKPKEENEHIPWYVSLIIISVIVMGQLYPPFGFTILGLVLLAVGLIKLAKYVPSVNDLADSMAMFIIATTMKTKGRK